MSRKQVIEAVDRFLTSDTPEVIVLRGGWGVGKTHLWEERLKNVVHGQQVTWTAYSYVSLFGIQSLDDVQFAVWQKSKSVEDLRKDVNQVGQVSALNKVRHLTRIVKERFASSASEALGGVLAGVPAILREVALGSISSYLVCIDDLERRSKDLQVDEILGLAANLRDSRKCWVVLIFNDDNSASGIKERVDIHRDKVFDREFTLANTSEEACGIVLDRSNTHHEAIQSSIQRLGVKNLRIVKRIQRNICELLALAGPSEAVTIHQIIHSAALFTWCNDSGGGEVPTLAFLESTELDALGLSLRELEEQAQKDESPEIVEWGRLLQGYGFGSVDDLDRVILEYVRTNTVDLTVLGQIVSDHERRSNAAKRTNEVNKVWAEYRRTLSLDEGQWVRRLIEATKGAIDVLSVADLSSAFTVLCDLKQTDAARSLLEQFIEARKHEIAIFDSGQYHFPIHAEIVQEFDNFYSKNAPEYNLVEIVTRMVANDEWHTREEAFLRKQTADQIVQLLQQIDGAYLHAAIRLLIRIQGKENEGNATEVMKALHRIAAESRLNALRFRRYLS